MKKLVRHLIGFGLLITGIAMILGWWGYVVALCRGAGGIVLALAGLLVLYTVRD